MKPNLTRNCLVVCCESTLILTFILLKTTDYWIQNDRGSELLPENWIYISQILFDQVIQRLLASFGLICSILLTHSMIVKRQVFPLWNILSGSLWLMMLLLPFNIGKVGISYGLYAVTSIQIISNLFKKRMKKSQLVSVKKEVVSPSRSVNSSIINPPCDLLDISKLDLGTSRKTRSTNNSPSVQSFGCTKPRPIISPSRFSSSSSITSHGNLTKASWVAGGYWQSNNWPSAFTSSPLSSPQNTPLTRSSSQSSGFGSVQAGFLNRSPPDSRPDSTLEELDRFSVFSDNVDTRFSDSAFRFTENSPNPYHYSNELVTPKPLVPSISSLNESLRPTSSNSSPNQWSCWLPFLLGFSLAINICVLSYFVASHLTRIEIVHNFK